MTFYLVVFPSNALFVSEHKIMKSKKQADGKMCLLVYFLDRELVF
ncbi:hypothetical protein BSM4216_1712 [Bacillus smithii]|nr:hypothetical protein BSM4216_1712 [Bacillus smithii]